MTLGEMVPWGRKNRAPALQDREAGWPGANEISPFLALHRQMNRLFDEVLGGFEAPTAWSRQWPTLEVQETENGYRVTAELPGLEERTLRSPSTMAC